MLEKMKMSVPLKLLSPPSTFTSNLYPASSLPTTKKLAMAKARILNNFICYF